MRSAGLLTTSLFASLLAVSGCSPEERAVGSPVEGNAGTLTWAVGGKTGEIRLSRVENRLSDGVLEIRAWGDRALADPSGRRRVPIVLAGRLPVERDLEREGAGELGMMATIPNADPGIGEPIPMLKLIAREVPGVDSDWTCTTEGRREIVCNQVHVMPWLATADVPTGAFRAVFGYN